MSYGAHGAVAAAIAAKKRKMQAEEEEMTTYNSEDLQSWEFKIVRSALGRFSKREFLQRICEEEAKAGWEMIEKFDDQRVRFKRPLEKRSSDQFLTTDPYRTHAGTVNTNAIIIAVVSLFIGLAVFATILLR